MTPANDNLSPQETLVMSHMLRDWANRFGAEFGMKEMALMRAENVRQTVKPKLVG